MAKSVWLQSRSVEPDHNNIFSIGFTKGGLTLVGTLGGLRVLDEDKLLPPPAHLKIDAPVYGL